MRITKLIKEIVGTDLEKKGFEYVKQKSGVWCFRKEEDGWFHWIYIVHSWNAAEVWVEIAVSRKKNDNSLTGFGRSYFDKEITQEEERETYFDEETFRYALERLLQQIEKELMPRFKELVEREHKWEITPAMQKRVYKEREKMARAILDSYGMSTIREDELVLFTVAILEAHREATLDEFGEELMGLAALWTESLMKNIEGCRCKWNKRWKVCRLGYPNISLSPQMERRIRFLRLYFFLYEYGYPLSTINSAWQGKCMETIHSWYNTLFVLRRKEKKAIEFRENSKIEVMEKRNEGAVVEDILMPFLSKYGYQYGSWQGLKNGYMCYRIKEAQRQEILLKRNYRTGEMWVSAVTHSGKELQLPDIEEGLGLYDGTEYCEYLFEWNYRRFEETVMKLRDQMEQIFMPALENEEKYLLKWELTHEMRRREFFERKKLSEKMKETYGEELSSLKDLPAFIKKILQENENKTMEEFGDILLGLGVMLGEAAISETEGSHWLWDKERSKCIITYGNEVTGIDPAFALNYAWQKKKPENVDRLWEVLTGKH